MKTYKIFANPQGQLEAVKQGWSWPGFIFNLIWALIKKMWGLGLGLFVLFFTLGVIEGAIEETSGEQAALVMSFFVNILSLIIGIIFGINGNKWREKKLISRGFDWKSTVNAENPEGAIALWLKGSNSNQTNQNAIQPTA